MFTLEIIIESKWWRSSTVSYSIWSISWLYPSRHVVYTADTTFCLMFSSHKEHCWQTGESAKSLDYLENLSVKNSAQWKLRDSNPIYCISLEISPDLVLTVLNPFQLAKIISTNFRQNFTSSLSMYREFNPMEFLRNLFVLLEGHFN